jgi:hypothetical protein
MENSRSLKMLKSLDNQLLVGKPQVQPSFKDCNFIIILSLKGWSYFNMDDFLSERGKKFKTSTEAVLKEFYPKVYS